jgi:hypothetical protein
MPQKEAMTVAMDREGTGFSENWQTENRNAMDYSSSTVMLATVSVVPKDHRYRPLSGRGKNRESGSVSRGRIELSIMPLALKGTESGSTGRLEPSPVTIWLSHSGRVVSKKRFPFLAMAKK